MQGLFSLEASSYISSLNLGGGMVPYVPNHHGTYQVAWLGCTVYGMVVPSAQILL
jgi:hypothetical protein